MECIMYSTNNITENNVDYIIDVPKLYNIRRIFIYCIEKNLSDAFNILNNLYDCGYSANDILLTFLKYIENYKDYKEFTDTINNKDIYKIISNIYIKVNNGIDSLLQLSSCLANIYILLNNIL